MDVVSLLIFVAIIVIAFFRKNNIGILALAAGVIAVRIFGLTDKDLINSVSVSLFTTLVGITLLFSIITNTGALDLLARKIVALAGKRIGLIPILVFLAGFAIVAAGPGGVPALAIIPPLAVAIAMEVGYNPLMLALIGISGMSCGRFSPITPESSIIISAVEEAGFTVNVIPAIWVNVVITNVILAVIFYIVFKGYKVKAAPDMIIEKNTEKFTVKQIVALLGIVAMLVLIIGFDVNIGLAALMVAAVLLIFHVADDSACIKSMPWSTIVMVLGVGALLSIVNQMGGIDLLTNALSSMMNSKTATPIIGLSAGLLSLVSSALGVVYPTMMPMCIDLGSSIGVNAAAMMSSVAAAGAISGISPMSTGGALIIAAITGDKKMKVTKEQENKVFVQLLIIAAVSLILLLIVAALFYTPVAKLLCPGA